MYEPYIFHKYNKLNEDLFEKIKNISTKNKNLDTIISNISLYSQDSFLRQIMNNLFSDEIPRHTINYIFFFNIFIVQEFKIYRYIMLCFRIEGLC